jgi:hypothetical protein
MPMTTELTCTKWLKRTKRRKAQWCGKPAQEYEVSKPAVGRTWGARSVLCHEHAAAAGNEGYTLKAVESAK